MKKIFLTFMFLTLISSMIFAQETKVLLADSISNSQTKIAYVDLDKIGAFDSISYSVYAMGEIDLDSLDIDGGLYVKEITYKGATTSAISVYEASEGATLTINNADGTATYVQDVATTTKAEARGYNRMKITLTAAAAGNDATDTTQKFILIATVYK